MTYMAIPVNKLFELILPWDLLMSVCGNVAMIA